LSFAAWVLWYLGYPDQALKKIEDVLILAEELSHPVSLAAALYSAVVLHHSRREWQRVQERTEALLTLSTEQGFAFRVARGTIFRGRVLAEHGQVEEGLAQIHQGIAADRAIRAEVSQPLWLSLLAEAYGKGGQVDEGLHALTEGLTVAHRTSEGLHEPELYRLKGELTLQKLSVISSQLAVPNPHPLIPNPCAEAEECFQKAIDIARHQQAKSLELRASVSLARLWQHQDKHQAARNMLAEIYGWFTEGFDTKDLQEVFLTERF
jgi:predicted ATPase